MTNSGASSIKVAIIGTGYFARFHYAAWQRMPDVSIIGLLTLDETASKEFQTSFGVETVYRSLDELLHGDADLIDIVTPPHTHAEFIRQCIRHNKAVVCQKPFCSSVQEAQEMVQHICDSNAFVAVHENFRFQPWYTEIKTILNTGRLGELYEIQFNFRPGDGQGEQAYLDRQPYFQTQPRFFIQETGIHFVDVFRYLVGDITGLFARLKKRNPVIAGEDGGVVLVDFKSGARGVLNGNRLSDHASNNPRLTMGEMLIEAANATLSLDGYGVIKVREHGSEQAVTHRFEWNNTDFGGDCVYKTNRHIADHLLKQTPVYNLAQDYLTNRLIEDAIYESDNTGCWVSL